MIRYRHSEKFSHGRIRVGSGMNSIFCLLFSPSMALLVVAIFPSFVAAVAVIEFEIAFFLVVAVVV